MNSKRPKVISLWLVWGWFAAVCLDALFPHHQLRDVYLYDPFSGTIITSLIITAVMTAAQVGLQLLTAKKAKGQNIDRGKQDDIRASVPGYGEFIPKGWGKFRVAPIWIWETPAVDHPVTTTSGGGGKMPKPPTNSTTEHIYVKSVAGVFHDGEIYGGVTRIWFDNDLVVNHNTSPALALARATLSSQKYEAEYGVLAGGASVADQAECSGGRKVEGIGGVPFDPVSIAGCKLWLKADSLALNDGDAVSTWTDSSGNGNNTTQGTAGKQPIYKSSVINSLPVLRFDGTDDVLRTSAVVVNGTAYTAFVIWKATAGAGTFRTGLFNGSQGSGDGWGLCANDSNNREVLHRGQAELVDAAITSNFEIWSMTRTASPLVDLWVDGTSKSLTNSSSTLNVPTSETCIGGQGSAPANPWNGDIAEILIYDSSLTTLQREQIETYLGNKYSVTVANPEYVSGSCEISVILPTTDDYELAVHYTSTTDLSFFVSVDGGSNIEIPCLGSGGATIVAIETLSLGSLSAGDHTLTFSNATGSSPDLDCIEIVSAQTTSAIDTRSFSSAVDGNKIPPTNPDHAWAYNNFVPDPGDGGPGGDYGTPHQTFSLSKYGQPTIRIYRGSKTQEPDPAIVAQEGEASTSAYRGWAYIVIDGIQLPNGRMPNVTLEVDQGVHSVPAIATDIYGLVGNTPAQLDVTALAGLTLGDTSIDPGTYTTPTYQNVTNATVGSGGAISKTSGATHAWNAHATSTASVASAINGSVRFTAGNGPVLIGFSATAAPSTTTDVRFGVLLNLTSTNLETKNAIQIWNGSTQGPDVGVWAFGDSFQVEIRNGRFRVYQNGIEISAFTPSVPVYPLYPVVFMYDTGAGPSALSISTAGAIGDAPSADAGGLLLSSRRSAGELLADLQTRFQFDMVEVDNVVKAILRSETSSDITIPYTDMRAVIASPGSLPEIPDFDCQISDMDRVLLPGRVDVNYLDPGLDYHNNTQSEMVLSGTRYDQQSVSLAIIDSADNMKRLAVTLLHKAEMESRSFTFQTSWKYMHVHPGSIATLPLANATHIVRVTQAKYSLPAGLIEFQGVRHAPSLYSPTASGSGSTGYEPPIAPIPANTKGVIIDGPLLRAEDAGDGTEPVVYVAMCGRGSGAWPGAFLYQEYPIGSGNYELVTTASQASQIGVTDGALATVDDPSLWDRDAGHAMTINFYTNTTLASATEQDLRANPSLNLLAIVNPITNDCEYIQFKTAAAGVPVAPYLSTYTISVFLRGRIGTDANVSSHTSADDVVVIDSTVKPRRMSVADIGR